MKLDLRCLIKFEKALKLQKVVFLSLKTNIFNLNASLMFGIFPSNVARFGINGWWMKLQLNLLQPCRRPIPIPMNGCQNAHVERWFV